MPIVHPVGSFRFSMRLGRELILSLATNVPLFRYPFRRFIPIGRMQSHASTDPTPSATD